MPLSTIAEVVSGRPTDAPDLDAPVFEPAVLDCQQAKPGSRPLAGKTRDGHEYAEQAAAPPLGRARPPREPGTRGTRPHTAIPARQLKHPDTASRELREAHWTIK